MARTSQWADNPEMWEHVARLRVGGLKYSDIVGRLAGKDKEHLGLEEIPSEDVIRYNLKKRSLLGKPASTLPLVDLEEHYTALIFMGNALCRKIEPPPTPRMRNSTPREISIMSRWQGFKVGEINWPCPKNEVEEEVSYEWGETDSGPEAFSQYVYFRNHLNATLLGRRVINGLSAVKRTADDYNTERSKLLKVVETAFDRALPDIDKKQRRNLIGTLSLAISPSAKNPEGKHRSSLRLRLTEPEIRKKVREVLEHLESSGANTDLVKKLRKVTIAQLNLSDALSPKTKVRRMIQDSECELCSATPLERAE